MKLTETKPFYENSGNMQEHFFSIQDQGMIFDILRSKMYSNPILAICREITSNARDAHREVGKQDIPIEIYLPNSLTPEFKVKDYGPGISPDRMVNIFIKYTASTKRNDNIQTGGFGLGAKTPFAYSDQFMVTTIHNGIKYSYVCSIDETKIGKLVLLDERATDEKNGTEITIPIKTQDFNIFRQYTEQACRFWDVKPQVSGQIINWLSITKILEGNNWAIAKSAQDWHKYIKLIIDGIEYPLDIDSLRKYADTSLYDACVGDIILYFGVGELSLSANREQVFLDKPTQEKIKARLQNLANDLTDKLQSKIDSATNLWEANLILFYELLTVFSKIDFMGPLHWKSYPLHHKSPFLNTVCQADSFTKREFSSRNRKTGKYEDKIKIYKSVCHSIRFLKNSKLFVNDLGIKDVTTAYVKKAFENDANLTTVYVLSPNDKITEEDLNKAFNLNAMAPEYLSSFNKPGKHAKTFSGTKLLIFKYDNVNMFFGQVSLQSMKNDSNKRVIFPLKRGHYGRYAAYNGNQFTPDSLDLLQDKNVSFYGLDQDIYNDQVIEKLKGVGISTYLDDILKKYSKEFFAKIKYISTNYYEINELFLNIDESKIIDRKSEFLKIHFIMKEMKNILNKRGLLSIYEAMNKPISLSEVSDWIKDNPDWKLPNTTIFKKYPMLQCVSAYNTSDKILAVDYINLIDKI